MAQVRPFGQPQNDGERRLIATLRDRLPKDYTIIGNPEIRLGHQVFEVDAVVLAPHAVYLLDAKGTGGDITVQGGRWFPRNQEPFLSPVAKIRDHAKKLKGEIERADPQRAQDLRAVWVEGLVVLVSPGARIVDDRTRTDSDQVVGIADIVDRILEARALPPWARPLGAVYRVIERKLLGAARNPGQTRLGQWTVDERLGGTETYDDFRAQDSALGVRAGSVRLRVYRLDPYLTGPEREKQRHLITNAYEALTRLPSHAGIIAAKHFFPRDGDPEQASEWVLVSEDIPGSALRLHLDDPAMPLTWDQKLVIAEELLSALAHCHAHGVVHRDLTPAAVLITPDGHAKLTAFDHARPRPGRSDTIAGELRALLDPHYQAPECSDDPGKAVAASDVFSLGVLLYECFAGERPWNGRQERDTLHCAFPRQVAAPRPDLGWLHDWLVTLCAMNPEDRPTAADALERFQAHLDPAERQVSTVPVERDYANLAKGTLIGKYQIEERLGKPGGFAVAYKALDIDADAPRVLKLVLKDRLSVLDRFRGEYRKLANLPEHPRIVRVLHGDVLPGEGPPYLVFPFVDAFDVQELINDRAITADEALTLAKQVADGLAHLHGHDLYHCDIKPRNLLWTDRGALIIDFNVAVFGREADHGGGQHRYLPPDYDTATDPTPADLADRDTFALALTLYEALTDGGYPWEGETPAAGVQPRDPRGVRTRRGKVNGNARLSQALVDVVLRGLHPHRAKRFTSAADLLTALNGVDRALAPETTSAVICTPATIGKAGSPAVPAGGLLLSAAPDTNPFVTLLATLYSQSTLTNCGTRGLDAATETLYVPTNLDRVLGPAVLARKHRLVVITGNAGDGKTAFLQRLEQDAVRHGALREPTATGAMLRFGGTRAAESTTAVLNPPRTSGKEAGYDGAPPASDTWTLITNHDGSQDAGAEANDAVLQVFFAPYRGETTARWPTAETRLIAINEGRLLDFLQQHPGEYPLLARLLRTGLEDDTPQDVVTVVNLTRRAVVATDGEHQSIVTRLMDLRPANAGRPARTAASRTAATPGTMPRPCERLQPAPWSRNDCSMPSPWSICRMPCI